MRGRQEWRAGNFAAYPPVLGPPNREEHTMEIPKDEILELIRQHGSSEKADQASQELPDRVDTDRDAGLLSKFGLDVGDLLGKLGGLPKL
jgi:hypothetical protein